jgi:hypothetical protein
MYMSKLSILKELADIRSIAQRKSTLKSGVLLAAAAYALMTFGPATWSYLSTATRLATGKLKSNVPLEFELERAKTMISDMIPDVRQNMLLIAQEEVGVEELRRQIARGETDLTKERATLVNLRTSLSADKDSVKVGSRDTGKVDAKEELTRRFGRYQVAESTLASQRQLLDARQAALEAAKAKLASMLNAKRDFEVQAENLQARLKTQQSRSIANSIEVNDTQVSRCQNLLNDVRARLEVADRLFNCEGDLLAMTSATTPSSEGIDEQIDSYFEVSKSGKPLVAKKK